jgi:hypothetical protein
MGSLNTLYAKEGLVIRRWEPEPEPEPEVDGESMGRLPLEGLSTTVVSLGWFAPCACECGCE